MTGQLCQLARDWRGALPAGGAMIEEKRDGWRALWIPDWRGRFGLYTRNGLPIEGTGHIAWRLEQMARAAGEATVFDGEFQVDGSLAATKAWCECGWKSGGEAGQFFAFDCLTLAEWRSGGTDRPLYERKAMLRELARVAVGDGWEWRPGSCGRDEIAHPVVVLEDQWLFDAAGVEAEARRVWGTGGEGLMLKDAEAGYERRRSSRWLKVKQGGAWRMAP